MPPVKRQKASAANEAQPPLLLETRPEIIRNVCSFLMLKEALALCQAHRQLNNAAKDIFQCSFIASYNGLRKLGFNNNDALTCVDNQQCRLCNLPCNECLRAVLRNESLGPLKHSNFMCDLALFSRADNAQAVTTLLEDGRCKIRISQLEHMLREDFTSMAAALQEDERAKNEIRVCSTRSGNVGCHRRANDDSCANHTQDDVEVA